MADDLDEFLRQAAVSAVKTGNSKRTLALPSPRLPLSLPNLFEIRSQPFGLSHNLIHLGPPMPQLRAAPLPLPWHLPAKNLRGSLRSSIAHPHQRHRRNPKRTNKGTLRGLIPNLHSRP